MRLGKAQSQFNLIFIYQFFMRKKDSFGYFFVFSVCFTFLFSGQTHAPLSGIKGGFLEGHTLHIHVFCVVICKIFFFSVESLLIDVRMNWNCGDFYHFGWLSWVTLMENWCLSRLDGQAFLVLRGWEARAYSWNEFPKKLVL